MSNTKAEIDLRNCEIAFRNAGLYSAYMQLELNIILADPLDIEAVSKILSIPQEPLRRFLNALTFLGLCEKNKFGKYKHIKDIIYTDKPTKILMQLIDQDIPHKLFKQPKTLDELQRQYPLENLSVLPQGKERSLHEYKNLLFLSGFRDSTVSVIGQENSRRQLIMVQLNKQNLLG